MKTLIQFLLVLTSGLHFMIAVADDTSTYTVLPEYDICNPITDVSDPHTVYLPAVNISTAVYINRTSGSSPVICVLYFKTCSNCYLKVSSVGTFDYSNCYRSTESSDNYVDIDEDTCTSYHTSFLLYDVDYKNQTTRSVVKYSDVSMYKTKSNKLHVAFCNGNCNRDVYMRLQITAMEKVELIKQDVSTSDQYFKSPYFPIPYSKNEEFYMYKIQAVSPDQVIVVSFDDWWITYTSYMEFEGSINANTITGAFSRPFVISKGQNMTVKFYTGGTTASSSTFLGFRAAVTFYSMYINIVTPKMDCDRVISSDGGTITFSPQDGTFRDCIWIIKRSPDSSGVFLKVIDFKQSYSRYPSDKTLEVLDGITSMGDVKLNAKPNDNSINKAGYLSASGFYIRARGEFSYGETIVLSYAMFIYDCQSYRNYFKCENNLCISSALKCDGFDSCGDNSDEAYCSTETVPKSGSDQINIGIIIPLVVSVFLIIIMCLLIIFIRRCRRLNNTANSNRDRPPGARPPQSRGRRHRRHRDVQMSVTLSSGEHPPSYDEVLQNTPIGYLNMAFTWSQHGSSLTQPPSYEEAVSPTSAQPTGSIVVTASANNGTSSNSQQQSSTSALATSISASLDPRAEVSSSSSSEDTLDPYQSLDISSSSDSSTENEHSMTVNNSNLVHSRSIPNLNIIGKNTDNEGRSHGAPKNGSENNEIQVGLRTASSEKLNTEIHEGVKSENNRRNEGPNKSTTDMNRHNETESQDRCRDSGDVRAATCDRVIQNPHSLERRREYNRNEEENYDHNRREDNERGRKEGRERYEHYRKHRGPRVEHTADREGAQIQGDYRKHDSGGINKWPSKMTDSSRSQSCVDLSWGGGATGLPNTNRTELRDEDKRFSYAGAGDMSLQRGSLDPFYNGRGLVRERPIEHLDKYTSQSRDNLRDGYKTRRHEHRNYETDERHNTSRQGASLNQTAYYSRNKIDRSDVFQPDAKFSGLSSVLEDQSNELCEETKIPETTSRYTHKNMKDPADKFQYSAHDNKKSTDRSNVKSSSNYRPRPDQMEPNYAPQVSSQDARGTSAGNFPLESTGIHQIYNASSSSQDYYTDDRAAHSRFQNNRKQPEHHYQNLDFGAQNESQHPNSKNNAIPLDKNYNSCSPYSNPTELLKNSKQSELTQEYERNPQSDQRRETTGAKPKPTLRMQFQAAQRPNREAPGVIPKPNSHLQSQTPQKPTPAPRHGVRKRQEIDASTSEYAPIGSQSYMPDNARPIPPRSLSATRYSGPISAQQMNPFEVTRPDSQHVPVSQSTGRLTEGMPGRDGNLSPHSSEQLSSRGKVQVQTTNDDVFV